MKKERLEKLLEDMMSTGANFAEVFLEDTKTKIYNYIDSNVDNIKLDYKSGVGLRIAKDNNVYYAATSNLKEKNITEIVKNLTSNISDKKLYNYVSLNRIKKYKNKCSTHYEIEDIKALFKRIDKKIRDKDKRINQVNISLLKVNQNVSIANNSGLYTSEERIRSRISIIVSFKDNDKTCNSIYSFGKTLDFDFLDLIDFDAVIDNLIKEGLDKLYAKPCIGGELPVIVENGFGGVIFHEACGHAMEATSVAPGTSVLANDLNNLIASPCVTIIDDGTIDNEWGSTIIDDEGYPTRKNILIENGVLKGFLIDKVNEGRMNMQSTGSGRREDYTFAPTSRMNNTYLETGDTSLEEMLKDIKLGLYAKRMGGGCVSPETGDFNFACDVAYMIRDGKIAECVKSASLIGNTKEILKNVVSVGDNLALGPGMCGSISGSVAVNVGMPRIKLSSILVGGEENED